MKVTIDGKDFELVEIVPEVNIDHKDETVYALKPLQKAERKNTYRINLGMELSPDNLEIVSSKDLICTEPTAKKIAKALEALVEYITDDTCPEHNRLLGLAVKAAEAFQEEQNIIEKEQSE